MNNSLNRHIRLFKVSRIIFSSQLSKYWHHSEITGELEIVRLKSKTISSVAYRSSKLEYA